MTIVYITFIVYTYIHWLLSILYLMVTTWIEWSILSTVVGSLFDIWRYIVIIPIREITANFFLILENEKFDDFNKSIHHHHHHHTELDEDLINIFPFISVFWNSHPSHSTRFSDFIHPSYLYTLILKAVNNQH